MILERPAIIWKPVEKDGKPVLDPTGAPVMKDASHIDQNGVLHSSSASMIQNFDERTPFGCPSKFWHAEVAGIPTPQSDAMALGDKIHAQVEHYLKSGEDGHMGPIVKFGRPMVDKIKERFPVFQIEQWIPQGFEVGGVKIRGRLDFIGRVPGDGNIRAIVDWKTTSSFEQYAKTPYQLRKDTQMILYRAAAEEMGCESELEMGHGYFQTKNGRFSEYVPTTIGPQQLREGIDDTLSLLEEMKKVARTLDSDAVKKVKSKCGAGKPWQCPYYVQCNPNKENKMGSMFAKYAAPAGAPAPAPQSNPAPATQSIAAPQEPPKHPRTVLPDTDLEVKAKALAGLLGISEADAYKQLLEQAKKLANFGANGMSAEIARVAAQNEESKKTFQAAIASGILPPDAPPSKPALAYDPVPGFNPIPEPLKGNDLPRPMQTLPASGVPAPASTPPSPRKPGRPPGAKNRKTTGAPDAEAGELVEVSDYEIIESHLSHGSTTKANVDPKSYEMLRIDYGLKARVRPGVDPEVVRTALSEKVQRGLYEEVCIYRPDLKGT